MAPLFAGPVVILAVALWTAAGTAAPGTPVADSVEAAAVGRHAAEELGDADAGRGTLDEPRRELVERQHGSNRGAALDDLGTVVADGLDHPGRHLLGGGLSHHPVGP